MKKVLIIFLGVCLILGGIGYSVWWGKVEIQARAFAAEEMPGPELLESDYPRLDKALSILRFDIKSSATGGNPADIFSRLIQAVGIRITLGAAVAVVGIVAVVAAFRLKRGRAGRSG